MSDKYKRPHTILLGLDGATFRFILPLVKSGHLKTFAHLMENGMWGNLESTFPPYTPQAWSTIFTGVNPGRHGVFGFFHHDVNTNKYVYYNSRSIKTPKIWNILDKHGVRSMMLNVPMTYPPERVNGCMVAGMMTPDKSNLYTYPPALMHWIDAHFPDYQIDLAVDNQDQKISVLDKIEKMMLCREKLMYGLLEKYTPDFMFSVFVSPDRVQHLFGKYLDPSYRSVFTDPKVHARLIEYFQVLDEMVGRLVDWCAGQSNIFIVSDHGFGGERGIFYTNEFLRRENLLFLKEDIGKRSLIRLSSFINVPFLKKLLPKKFISRVKRETLTSIDYERTLAFAASIPQQGIIFNRQLCGDKMDRTKLFDTVSEKLKELRCPCCNSPCITQIYQKEELYHGPYVEKIPDILFSVHHFEFDASDVILNNKLFDLREKNPRGKHLLDGIFIAQGPNIRRSGKIKGLTLQDIAPTIFKTFHLGDGDYDGRPIDGVE